MALRIETLNIRGFRAAEAPKAENKWNYINQVVRDKKIGILLVQEAHLSDDQKDKIEDLFGKRLKIHHSPDSDNPTRKGGVVVVLKKNLINIQNSKMKVIIPGRAVLVSVNWHRDDTINILMVYALNMTENNSDENRLFWTQLKDYLCSNPSVRVDVMVGDCNMVEEARDRSPARDDPAVAVEALDQLKQVLYLRDAWCDAYPINRTFSYIQDTTSSMSQINQIYMTDPLTVSTREWSIGPTGIPETDYKLLTVQIAHADAPIIGRGR